MRTFLRLKQNKTSEVFLCECRKCENKKSYTAYSWEHVKDLGWGFERADVDGENKKLSGTNKDLRDNGGNLVSMYCPKCK